MAKIFTGTVRVALNQQVKWEDNPNMSEVLLNFGKMNGKIATDAERAVNTTGNFAFVPQLNADYCIRVASSISGLPLRVFDKMPYADFDVIRQTVAAFIGGRDPQKFYDQLIKEEDDEDEDEGDDEVNTDSDSGKLLITDNNMVNGEDFTNPV